MSGKREKPDSPRATPGSRMLRKARSFKEDIKAKVIRRTPSLGRSPSPSPHKSPKSHRRRQPLHRGSSFNEGGRTESLLSEEDDVDRLETASRKVLQALHYMEDAVNKHILLLLPGAATIVLETVMDMNQLLSNHFLNQDSTALMSTTNQVYQALAQLLRWSDQVLLHVDEEVNKENAHEVIKSVQEGVEELRRLSQEKMKLESLQPNASKTTTTPASGPSLCQSADSSHRSSLPDIPLTPRERKILEETSLLSGYTAEGSSGAGPDGGDGSPAAAAGAGGRASVSAAACNGLSRSSDCILDAAGGHYPTGLPPPKPPLPKSFHSSAISRAIFGGSHSSSVPPPLPAKKRSLSTYDNSPGSPSSSHCLAPPDPASPHSVSPGATVTPLSQSPTSSLSSAFSAASSEDLLAGGGSGVWSRTSSLTSPTHAPNTGSGGAGGSGGGATTEVRLSQYDNFRLMHTRSEDSEHGTDQIHAITRKIKCLTSSIDAADDVFPIPPEPAAAAVTGAEATDAPTSDVGDVDDVDGAAPPPLPDKKTCRPMERTRVISHYDNVHVVMRHKNSEGVLLRSSQSVSSGLTGRLALAVGGGTAGSGGAGGLCKENFSSSETFSSSGTYSSSVESLQKPPPLPPKRKHVQAYMAMFKDYEEPSVTDQARHSVHSINYYQEQWFTHQLELFHPLCARSNTVSVMSDISSRSSDMYSVTSASSSEEGQTSNQSSQSHLSPPPLLPPKTKTSPTRRRSSESKVDQLPSTTNDTPTSGETAENRREIKGASDADSISETSSSDHRPLSTGSSSTRQSSPPPEIQKDGDSDFAELSTLDDVDVSDQLIRKKKGEDGVEIRGGSIDALIVHATIASFMYQEAFLTTYRTFLSPHKLIEKLLYRYNRFARINDAKKKKLSRNAFSLLIRVVDELCTEVNEDVLQLLMDLEAQLVCDGELPLAKILRRKLLEKCELLQRLMEAAQQPTLLSSHQITAKQYSLTEFKSEHIAEQMTLLDAELFQKIEISEVLLFSREQNEEHSPNLTKFTEHFNKMSFWCRTRILEQEDPRERERYLIKMIKIMKHLRKFNNFNSYLAILAALDSAPVRRLEWQKQNLEALREFCLLIDSSSSFRAYRLALSETEPPCIPYIGLVLQDLTFVHIGNPDSFSDGNINFAKRWQQFNILDNMRRFLKCNYTFKKHPKIISYINNFDYYLSDESLWQISENIKPRGRHKPES